MKLHGFLSVVMLLTLCTQNVLQGQTPTEDNTGYPETALNQAIRFYSKTIREGSGLYNGRVYNFRYIGVSGNPFYPDNVWSTGSVLYDGQLYDSINMKFDIFNNLLIIDYYDENGFFINLQLVNEKIERFGWPGHLFMRIEADTTKSSWLPSGFYDQLYVGSVRVLASYKKSIQKNNQIGNQLEAFSERDLFYIEKDGKIFRVKKKRSVMEAFSDREREIRTFIKKHKLKFRTESGRQFSLVAAYYDSIHEN